VEKGRCHGTPGVPGFTTLLPEVTPMAVTPLRCLTPIAAGVLIGSAAWGHKPSFSEGSARDAQSALQVKDHTLSQVVYHAVTEAAPRLWLTFEAKEGQSIYLQLGMPALDRLKTYRPAMALLGPELPALEAPFPIPEGLGGRLWTTESVTDPRFFHEPFTGTDSWILMEQTVAAPADGRYYAVAYVPSGQPGKLWLAIGQREDFGLADLGKMGEWTREVRAFHEVGGRPGWWAWATAIGAALAAAAAWALARAVGGG
jgi:hypothetical protein